ncbi:MAG: hypothetical protein IT207_01440 [Fimbriimonadaceae bacterium]|nr:hypothetical protein [Fimbriimonadaceae bacterium]
MNSLRIGLATSVIKTEHDPDEAIQLQAFASAGHAVEMVAWDDEDADVSRFDVIVLRSTWNYPMDPQGFLSWCHRVSSVATLVNPLPAVRWNIDKVYLTELRAHGVATVPSVYFERGQRTVVSKLFDDWGAVVVKPRISAGSLYTKRFDPGSEEECQKYLNAHVAERAMMVQPFLAGVETLLEHCLIVIGGNTTHAIAKQPRFSDGTESVGAALEPSEFERSLATRVIASLPFPVSYARIDLMPDEDGDPLVSEVELIEPSLFFAQNPAALDTFVETVVRYARDRKGMFDWPGR